VLLGGDKIKIMTEFKSPHWLDDEDILKLGVQPSEVEMYRRYHYQQQFGIGQWYESLKEHTFPTEFLPLSMQDVLAILETNSQTRSNSIESIKPEHREVLKSLEQRIDNMITPWRSHGVFIKLNTRSPKDVSVDSVQDPKRVRQIIQWVEEDLCAQRCIKYDPTLHDSLLKNKYSSFEIMRAITKACTRSLHVTSGSDAISLLLASTRIHQDLSRVESFGIQSVPVSIVVRQWNENVLHRPSMEFRGFVYNNSLNALTQYDNVTFYAEVASNKRELQERILRFFNESVRDKLTHIQSYVIDFFVDENRVYVIELNPFHTGAGACLFSWRENRELFMNGPFEFRVVEAPHENPLAALPAFWEKKLTFYLNTENTQSPSFSMTHYLLAAGGLAALGYLAYRWKSSNRD